MPKTGRPPGLGPEHRETFEGLCEIQCTITEVSRVFKVTDKTVTSFCDREYGLSFSEAFKKFSAGGLTSLRRKQFALALGGNGHPAMLIWLGKQYLGQRDTPATDEHRVDIPAPIYSIASQLKKVAGE